MIHGSFPTKAGCNARYVPVLTLCAIAFAGCSSTNSLLSLPASSAGAVSALDMRHLSSSAGYRVLFSFGRKGDGVDGIYPFAGLVDVKGKLYGTTGYGGKTGGGTVFRITRSGKEKVLHNFKGSDGSYPDAALLAVGDMLYGTTLYGGSNGAGTVFTLGTSGSGFRVLYSFAGGNDGEYPMAGLTDVGGTLYGTTYQGGAYGDGTVFSVNTMGTENVLHNFAGNPDGKYPLTSLLDIGGTLYGTTQQGGAFDAGTVFGLTMAGSEQMLYSFNGSLPAARYPHAGVIDVGGTLYGTTGGGGANDEGTVFSISTTGTNEQVLYSFNNNGSDGIQPAAALTLMDGTLYSTTYEGGAAGYGTVFSITTSGAESVLHSFGESYSNDGAYPTAGLVAVEGSLYGTTYYGGFSQPSPSCSYGCYWGTVFALKP